MHQFLSIVFFLCTLTGLCQSLPNKGDNYTPTYSEMLEFYREVANRDGFSLWNAGETDSGEPLHVLEYLPKGFSRSTGMVLLINNAIHPGEPCGVNACMELIQDVIAEKIQLKNTALVIIPGYNIGGMKNRSSYSRANQEGPDEYGFRGNAKNLDLNRDFIKMDSKNSFAFARVFHKWKPEVFVDTHTSNGADYPYTGTLITTQLGKLGEPLASYVKNKLEPSLYANIHTKGWPMVPYIFGFNGKDTPLEGGISDYMDSPRYSTGYTALFGTVGFVTEAHMYKSFQDRVAFTKSFLKEMMVWMDQPVNNVDFKKTQQKHWDAIRKAKELGINWTIDSIATDSLPFTQYKKIYEKSAVTGLQHWKYDKEQKESGIIPFRRNVSTTLRKVPDYYLIPKAYTKVIQRLLVNGVLLEEYASTGQPTFAYKINSIKATPTPYEGHFFIYDMELDTLPYAAHAVSYVKVRTNQLAKRYIVEVLEPDAMDSFFRWNFFNSSLQQKEYFSPYSFEPKMKEYLKSHPELRKKLNRAKAADPELSRNHHQQLSWLYENSPFKERSAHVYPVLFGWEK